MDALASQLNTHLAGGGTADPVIENLQVDGRLMFNPTPPAIDIYPADPFQQQLAMGKGNKEMFFLVRARVSTADHEGGQDLLLSMMDPDSSTSVAKTLERDRTLGSVVEHLVVDGPSGFGVFPEPIPNTGALLGCTWTVEVYP